MYSAHNFVIFFFACMLNSSKKKAIWILKIIITLHFVMNYVSSIKIDILINL